MCAVPVVTEQNTKTRLLDVAELLFGERGFEVVSLRDITTEAEANLAAVNYHFGSKDGLIHEVISRRLRPINEERLRLLSQVEKDLGGLRAILDAFLQPVVTAFRSSDQTERIFFRLMGRCMSHESEHMNRLLVQEFGEVIGCFVAALARVLPELTREQVFFRLMFVAGVMAHTMLNVEKLAMFMGEEGKNPELDKVFEEMLEFVHRGCGEMGIEGEIPKS